MMRSKFSRGLLPAFVFLGATLTVEDSQGQANVIGPGAHTCGTYLQNTGGPGADEHKLWYVLWAQGYVSGTNMSNTKQSTLLERAVIAAFIDNFCRRNPLKHVVTAAMALVSETGGANVIFKYEK